jgi:hypothetical protein
MFVENNSPPLKAPFKVITKMHSAVGKKMIDYRTADSTEMQRTKS